MLPMAANCTALSSVVVLELRLEHDLVEDRHVDFVNEMISPC